MDNNGKRERRKLVNSKKDQRYDNGSLIPSTVIDQASQRVFLVSLFILLQSWKIYDVVMIKSKDFAGGQVTGLNNFTFVLKYAILDGAFLWLLPILNVQYLTFSPLKTLVLTLVVNVISFFLVSDAAIPFLSTVFLPIWKSISSNKELTIIGESVNTRSVVDIDAHFKGKYVIQYLPDSSAKFNPFHFDKICLSPDSKKPFYMPIEFNSTNELGSLHIQHITPQNELRVQRYEKYDIQKLLKRDYSHLRKYDNYVNSDDRVFYLEIPISEPGLYRIKKVTDNKGISIRSYKSDFRLSSCPRISFSYPSSHDFNKNYICQGEEPDLHLPLVKSTGVHPMVVEFSVEFGKQKSYTFNSTIGSDANIDTDEISSLQPSIIVRNLLEQEFSKHLPLFQSAPVGPLNFQIVKVTDFLGNTFRYNPSSNDKDIHYAAQIKPIPRIALYDPNPQNELVVNGSKWLKFSIIESGDEALPITVEIGYESFVDSSLSYKFVRSFESMVELSKGLEIKNEGKYRLLDSQSKFCKCKLSSVSPIDVKLANPPTVSITADPIIEKCVGMTGFKFEYHFQGKAPFEIQYNVYQNMTNGILKPLTNSRGVVTRSIRSLENSYKFEYKPPSEGNYVIIFNSITDSNYKSPIQLDRASHTYSTYFNQRSKMSISGATNEHKYDLCYNESISLPLDLKGNLPFSLQYDIIDTNTQSKLIATQEITDAYDYTIKTPPFVKGGTYELKLSNAKDSLSCDVDFNESVLIKARSDIPVLSIDEKKKHIQIVEGDSVSVPLKLLSSVGYSSNDYFEFNVFGENSDSPVTKRKSTGLTSLSVKEAGRYELTAFKNRGCEGTISSGNENIFVSYYPKPNLTIVENNNLKQHKSEEVMHLTPFCQNAERKIDLLLEGEAPFVVDYDIKLPNGKTETKSISVKGNQASLKVPSSQNGLFEFHFKAIFDKLYTREKMSRLSQTKPKTIRYGVNTLPNAYFDKSHRYTQICETDFESTQGIKIPLNLVGAYPFNLNLTLLNEQTNQQKKFTMRNVDKPFLNLKVDDFKLNVGSHVLKIDAVDDFNGCKRTLPEGTSSYVIYVTKVPSIEHLGKKNYYCVGDHVNYNLTGIPPFTVYYNFNGKLQKAESSNKFQRLASKPGNLSIMALSDSSANKCLVNVTQNSTKYEKLQTEIYELPSVEINQGDYIIQDIHEGDQTEIVFAFQGTPPFTLTYIRSVEASQSNKKAKGTSKTVERKTITGIMEHEYSIMVNLEGTYEAIEVSDAFCTARRESY